MRRMVGARSVLQQIDYTFYNRLEEAGGEITEEFLWYRLAPLLGYLDLAEKQQVRDALTLAYNSHDGQMRKSGEKYITHPVEVTRILAELRMDHESLIAGLLHDTVEDTKHVTLEEIGVAFGEGVMKIVEGETRFSKLGSFATPPASGEAVDVKALDLQQLFLAMTEEVRIIVVKLADRLHNMRTLGSMPQHKQKKIADETLQVFAPLARLLGLYSIKEELEALSFKYSDPAAHQRMLEHLNWLMDKQAPVVEEACQTLESIISASTYLRDRLASVTVEPHNKALYSLHRKLQSTGLAVKDLRDVAQVRVVLHPRHPAPPAGTSPADHLKDQNQLCYNVMGLVHAVWAPIPQKFKDYIATPKPNGYQSLHTTVVPLGSDELFPLEVHIRTGAMHRLAQYGIAGESWMTSFRKGSGSSTSTAASDPGPQSPTEAELAPISSQDSQYQAAGPARAHLLSAALEQPRPPDTLRGPLGGTRPSGVPVNGARHGVHINGFAVKSAADCAVSVDTFTSPALNNPPQGDGDGQAGALAKRAEDQLLAGRVNWLTSIREWQKEFLNTMPPREFVDCVTDDLFGQGVFVFTPSGQPMRLPKGATVVDFAYHLHTDVGNQMKGAKVNGVHVPPDHKLSNAEVVEIVMDAEHPELITAQDVLAHKKWRPTTRSARHKLAQFVKRHEHLLQPDPNSPDGRLIAAGILNRVLDMGDPMQGAGKAAHPQVAWLLVRCSDRSGLLAEVASTIAAHGHNILSYDGVGCPPGGNQQSFMQFVVNGDPALRRSMVNAIQETPTVASVEAGPGQPPASQLASARDGSCASPGTPSGASHTSPSRSTSPARRSAPRGRGATVSPAASSAAASGAGVGNGAKPTEIRAGVTSVDPSAASRRASGDSSADSTSYSGKWGTLGAPSHQPQSHQRQSGSNGMEASSTSSESNRASSSSSSTSSASSRDNDSSTSSIRENSSSSSGDLARRGRSEDPRPGPAAAKKEEAPSCPLPGLPPMWQTNTQCGDPWMWEALGQTLSCTSEGYDAANDGFGHGTEGFSPSAMGGSPSQPPLLGGSAGNAPASTSSHGSQHSKATYNWWRPPFG